MHPGAVGVTGDAKGRIDRERAFVGYAEREEEGEGSRHGLGKQEVEVVLRANVPADIVRVRP